MLPQVAFEDRGGVLPLILILTLILVPCGKGDNSLDSQYHLASLEDKGYTYQAGGTEQQKPENDVLGRYIDGVSEALSYRPWKPKRTGPVRFESEHEL